MSMFLKLSYGVGLTPWEHMRDLPVGKQALTLLERHEQDREPPYGQALDLGCGSGIWAVELARRGWEVTGVDIVPKAVRRARKRAREAGVAARFVAGDLGALESLDVGRDHRLVLDFGAVHGLTDEARAAVGRAVSAVASDDAAILMYAMAPGRRGPLPRGMSRADVEATYPGWRIVHDEPFDVTDVPRPMRKAEPHWYELRRA